LQIGTAHNKNIDRTIQALAEIPCHLIILGKLNDAQISLLDDLKIKYTAISHALSESELYELYKSVDIVTLISTLEGFGMTIIEANQMGIPVITADITSMPWVAADAAVLVDPYDSQSIKNGFMKLIQNESYRNQLIENGYRNIKRFDKKVIAQQYFDLYRGLS
jgi:glycosyltransferase involved in cell wall biosynthesis